MEAVTEARGKEKAEPWYLDVDLNWYIEKYKARYLQAVELAKDMDEFVSYHAKEKSAYAKEYAVVGSPEPSYTKPPQLMLMEQLVERVAAGKDSFATMPIDKDGQFIASLGRLSATEQKMRQDCKTKMELAREGLETKLLEAIKSSPAPAAELSAVLRKAKKDLGNAD